LPPKSKSDQGAPMLDEVVVKIRLGSIRNFEIIA
jgi:hypothetical protein